MIILVIIGVVLIAFAIGIVAHVFSPKSEQQAKTIGQIRTYGFSRRAGEGEDSTGRMRERFDNLAGWLGSAMVGRGGDSTNLDRIRAQLVAAGIYKTTPGKFLGYRVLCTIGLPLLWFWFGITVHVSPVLLVIVTLLAIAGGWFLPLQFVKDQANRRLFVALRWVGTAVIVMTTTALSTVIHPNVRVEKARFVNHARCRRQGPRRLRGR